MSLVKSVGPECPECMIRAGKVIRSGVDQDGHPVRQRECQDCTTRFTTVEVVVPNASFENLDVERKMYQKLHARKKRGYWGQKSRKSPLTYRLLVAFRVMQGPKLISQYSELNTREEAA